MLKTSKNNKKTSSHKANNNRLHTVMAIIFFTIFSVIIKLYFLQIIKYDYYFARANEQHQVKNELKPNRGKILIRDIENFYPIATNKDFANVFAVPKDIENPKDIAEKLYNVFEKEKVEVEVDRLFKQENNFASSTEKILLAEVDFLEFLKKKKEEEIELRKNKLIEEYLLKLSKKDDPYEPIENKVSEEKLELLKDIKGISYNMENYRYYPQNNTFSHLLGFVTTNSQSGSYGLEGFFNDDLSGKKGLVSTEKSALGKLIIINDRNYEKAINGNDIILTINQSIQFEAFNELKEAVSKYAADGGSVIVMDPATGAIIAMCSYPDFNPNNYSQIIDTKVFNNPAIFDAYEPGSVFKAFTIASGIDVGVIEPDTTYEDKGFRMIKGWSKPIKNSDFATHGGHGRVDMNTVLSFSLNTGTIFIEEKMGAEIFADYVRKFGFGEKTGIELETENGGNIDNLNRKVKREVEVATASFGQGITANPLQVIAAYGAIANGGMLMKPYLVSEIINSKGEKSKTEPVVVRRVISERAAMLTAGMLVNVVDSGHSTKAAVPGYFVAGKTGTAQIASAGGYGTKTTHTFVGFSPVDNPKFVMLVRLNSPKNVQYADSSTAPTFSNIAKFILDYYKVPTER